MEPEYIISEIVDWLKKQVTQSNMKGFIIGLSGGLDSAVTAVLCKKTGFPTLCLIMPCHSSKKSIEDAKKIAEKFNIKTKIIDLTNIYDNFLKLLSPELNSANKIALGNLKSRLRMITLYYFANNLSYLVVGAGNYTELKLGYFTKYGDGGVDLLPIGDLVKSEVRLIGKALQIPEEVLNKPPSADLWTGQTDEDELGCSYNILDKVVRDNLDGLDARLIEAIQNRIKRNAHKRKTPPICILHNK
ncbi:MAG: NAD+ synthase [Candidatus Odinarchaeia archaeon]